MEFVTLFNCFVLSLFMLIASVSHTNAIPVYDAYIVPNDDGAIDRMDYDYYQPIAEPLATTRMDRLRRGYYYVDDGYITSVPVSSVPVPHRRQDLITVPNGGTVQYTPLIKYKHTRTKHKKLFVPNLFG